MIDPRPWCSPKVKQEAETNTYAEYTAWERWFTVNLDDTLPDGTESILDTLDSCQKAYLFNLMGRLADQEFSK